MERDNIILIGAGGHCKSCIEVIELLPQYNIRGIVDNELVNLDHAFSYPVLGDDATIPNLVDNNTFFLIAVGQIKTATIRRRLYEQVKGSGGAFVTVISPSALISKRSSIGKGSIIFNLAIVNTCVTIGTNVIVNNKALIEHDCIIGNHTHISTGAVVNGKCVVGEEVFVGSNTVLVQGIRVTSNVVIGAGSVVAKDIESPGIYVGNPAKKIADIE
ncbi:MAG: acetyltransferase [Chitinophagaceae bacterium]|nr:acetyltransferase [Chitinophagaceae bacterium]